MYLNMYVYKVGMGIHGEPGREQRELPKDDNAADVIGDILCIDYTDILLIVCIYRCIYMHIYVHVYIYVYICLYIYIFICLEMMIQPM
jgi:hypothetical protein